MSATDWVNGELFKDLLLQIEDDFREIIDFNADPALTHGENYLTTVLRVKIDVRLQDGSEKCVKFILKIPLAGASSAEHEFHALFVAEADMHANIIPELEKLHADAGHRVQFKPQHFRFPRAPVSDYILMEDLQCRGFSNGNRLVGLDETHMKCVLEKLAQWHAASAKRVEAHGAYPPAYTQSYFAEEQRQMIDDMNAAFSVPFLECLEKSKLQHEQKVLIRNYMQRLTELYFQFGQVEESGFNVLNHGDCWLNNFMFQYQTGDEASIKDVLFVDFQLPKYGTPAQDLHCLLMTSPKMALKLGKFDDFIAFYHAKLVLNLQLLNYQRPLPQLSDLQQTLKRDGLWSFVCVQRLLAVALYESSETANIESFMSNSDEGVAFRKRMFSNPAYVKQIEQILPWLIEHNYLQCT